MPPPIGVNDTLEPTGPGYVVVRGKDVGLDASGFGQNLALTDVNLQLLAQKLNSLQLAGLDFLRKSTIGTWAHRVVAGEPTSGQFKAATASLEIAVTDADGSDRSAALAGLEAGNRIAALAANGLEAFSGVITGNTLVAGRRTLALSMTRGHIGNLAAGTRYILAQVYADRALSMEVSNVFSAAVSGGVLQIVAVAGGIPGQATPPPSPSVGDLWIDLSITPPALRRWDGTTWATIGAASGAGIPVQATAPTNPATNDLWVNTANDPATLRRYNGTSWVVVGGAAGTAIPVQATAPANPVTNELWVDISANPALLRRYDGTAWLAVGATGSGFTIPIQSVAPDSPSTDDLWIDTSGTPAFLRRYDGAVWDDVGGVSVLSHVTIGALTYSTTAGVTPATGRFKSVSGTLYLSETDADGASLVTALDSLMAGGRLALRATTGHEIWSAKIDSIVDSGAYRTVRISDVRGAITFVDGTRYVFHEATTFRADRIQVGPGLSVLEGSTGTAQIDLDEPQRWQQVSEESQFTSLRAAGAVRLVAARDLTITAVNTVTEVDGTQITAILDGDLFIWNEQTTPNRWERFGNINADARVQAAKGTALPGNTPGTPSAGTSDAWAPDNHDHGITPGTGGMADGVATSVALSLSGNVLSLAIGRSGALQPLSDTQDLSSISGNPELPRWHHVAAESQFAALRTAGYDRLVADRDLTITASSTVTEVNGTQITSVKNGDLFIWNEQVTPRWQRFGNIGGLSSVATDNTITGDGSSGNPLSVDYGDVARDTFAVRIAWTATSTIIESALTGASVRVGTTGQLLSIPRSTLPDANQFVSLWIGTTDTSRIRSVLTGPTSLLGAGRLWNSSVTMSVGGVAGTLYTSASVAPDEHEGTVLRVTITPEDLDAFIQHVIEERVADFAEQGYEGDLPDGLQPVEANPTGTDGDALTRIGIRGTNYNIPSPSVDGSTSVRSRVGHLDSVTIPAGTARLIALTEEAAAGNDYQVEITDDSLNMTVRFPMIAGEAIRAKTNLASVPTTYQNALLASVSTKRFNDSAFTNQSLDRWNLLKGTSNSQLYLVNVANSDGALTIEVWKYPRALQGLKGDKGDKGDQGGAVTFGAAAGQVSEIAEGNNTDPWPFSKIEIGEAQGTVGMRFGWNTQQDLGGTGVETSTTGTGIIITAPPQGATQMWIAVRVDNASDVTAILVGGSNHQGAGDYFSNAGVELTFNSETWFRFLTRNLTELERQVLQTAEIDVRLTPDNLDEHIDRRAEEEVRRLRRVIPVIETISLSDAQFATVNSAGQAVNLTWPAAVLNQLPNAPAHASAAKQYSLNVPATSGAATWTEAASGGGGDEQLDGLHAVSISEHNTSALTGAAASPGNAFDGNTATSTSLASGAGTVRGLVARTIYGGRVVLDIAPATSVTLSLQFWLGTTARNTVSTGAITTAGEQGVNAPLTTWDRVIIRATALSGGAASLREVRVLDSGSAIVNLAYTAASRTITNPIGNDAVLPQVTDGVDGLMIAADKSKLDTYPNNANQLQINPADGQLLEVLAEREARDTTLNLGQFNNVGDFGIRISPTPQYGSFDPPVPSGDAGTLLQLNFIPGSEIVNNIQLQNRIIVYINEAEASRTYLNRKIRWGPVGGAVQVSNLHYLNRGFNNENRYYSDVLTHRPAVGGTTTARFNLEDVAAEAHETFPGNAWVWHSQGHVSHEDFISNGDIPDTNPSTTVAPTQRAVKAYADALPGTIEGVQVYYWDGDTDALPDLNASGRANVAQVGTSNADRITRLVFGATARESYFNAFTVTRLTSAQAEATNIDQVGSEAIPAGHVFQLGPGTYGVEIAGRFFNKNNDDRHSRQSAALAFVQSSTDDVASDSEPAQSGGSGSESTNPLLASANVAGTFRLRRPFFEVAAGNTAEFYAIFGTGGRTLTMSAVMIITKYRS